MPEKPIHPGRYVKENILPPGLTVTAAAKLLGVGRPALTNFLNGKAALSPEMAHRLERAFGADRQRLLELQTQFDSAREPMYQQTTPAGAYAPAIHAIKAQQIESWADGIEAKLESWADRTEARQQLAALLRRLIHSTGRNLALVDFPAFDNAERPGWDGIVETAEPTPWIPDGRSGWEFSCKRNPKSKADGDYTARIKSVPVEDRIGRTFVFVTLRNWPGKRQWAEDKKALGHWKDVRAYDASDLEQWIEQSAPVQVWFAERLGRSTQVYRSLAQCWSDWASASEPELPQELFDSAVRESEKKFKDWLQAKPDRPFVIAADSRDEALAFLASLAKHFTESEKLKTCALDQRAIVCDTPEALRRLDTAAPASLVIAAHGRDVERELANFYRRFHCIVIRLRSAVNSNPDITLAPLSHENFEKALGAMNIVEDRAERLARESGRSPTILRRRLSRILAIREPEWAADPAIARKLTPMALAGAWHETSPADCEVVRLLANADEYRAVEDNIVELRRLDDPPIWSVADHRGVVSRIDALFAIAGFITKQNLEDFFLVAEYVLSETDPALDLPDGERWAAEVYGKVRDHSRALRNGIRETLVLLAVYGNALFLQRLGFDVHERVSRLVQKLLDTLTAENFFSYNDDLPDYAEAAPETFLRLIEQDLQDLRESESATLKLMRSVNDPLFVSNPSRTGLLWALERLAWSPDNLPRVAHILARLSSRKIEDNLAINPERSLQCIFCSWMPQTAAPVDDRMRMLEKLVSRYPEVGWALCIKQFEPGQQIGHYNARPNWRDDASGVGQPVSQAEWVSFVRKAIDLALNRSDHDERTLLDLVGRLEALEEGHREAVWKLIERWAAGDASEDAKAELRQRIRSHMYLFRRRGEGNLSTSLACPPEILAKLQPKNLVIRHAWLFSSALNEWSFDDPEYEDMDDEERNKNIRERQLEVLSDIWRKRGFSGVDALLDRTEPGIVGQIAAELLTEKSERIEFVRSCLRAAFAGAKTKYEKCLKGFLRAESPDFVARFSKGSDGSCSQDDVLFLHLCLPFRAETWRRIDAESEEFKNSYWRQVVPLGNYDENCIDEIIDRLLEMDRQREAFDVACRNWSKVETTRLVRLLETLPTAISENRITHGLLRYYISKAFDELDNRLEVADEEKARLELRHISVLDRNEHGIPNLEKQIASSPALYAQMIALSFKRDGDGEDPPKWRIDDHEHRQIMARVAYDLLDRMRRIPGTNEQGVIDTKALKDWIGEVRALCKKHGRAVIGDQMIGQLLARERPEGDVGRPPCRQICEALEWMASEHVGRGFSVGILNNRGVHWLGKGGQQERDLAAAYRECARRIPFEFSYVRSVLDDIAANYEQRAGRWDDEENARQRLP